MFCNHNAFLNCEQLFGVVCTASFNKRYYDCFGHCLEPNFEILGFVKGDLEYTAFIGSIEGRIAFEFYRPEKIAQREKWEAMTRQYYSLDLKLFL